MNLTELSVPTVIREGTKYIVRWSEGVEVVCDELYKHTNKHIEAFVEVKDYKLLDGPLLIGPVRTFITKTWKSFRSEIEEISDRPDWSQRLQQVSTLVRQAFNEGNPAVGLGSIEKPPPPIELVQDFLWEGTLTILFGNGGIGKSFIGLQLAQALHSGYPVCGRNVLGKNVLWLDWETTVNLAYWRNMEVLQGRSMDYGEWTDEARPDSGRTHMVFYKEMVGELASHTEQLAGEIERLNIDVLLIDSAIPASGGRPETSEAPEAFFNALRAMKPPNRELSSILIAHITKEQIGKKGSATPFGSTVWKDRARDVFELVASQKTRSSHTDYMLHQLKTNMGPLKGERAMRLTWDQGCQIEEIPIGENPELVATLTPAKQARMLIGERGPMTEAELASAIDNHSVKEIVSSLSKDGDFDAIGDEWNLSKAAF